jgi:hypothetical protein
MTKSNDDFDLWWNENEKQFISDSLHMSDYHIASIVWNAAIKSEKEKKKERRLARIWYKKLREHNLKVFAIMPNYLIKYNNEEK